VTALLRFDSVSCVRGGRLLFEQLSFEVGAGEALHVTGPNGSGKSSLLRLAAGLLRASAGKVDSAPLALADDSLALDRELPLRKALDFWGGDSGAALDALGLTGLAEVPVRFLSAGQSKRASLARTAASGAPLWLLDEPANALDARSLELLQDLVDRHRSSGGAVVAASHLPLAGGWRTLELGR
jgi:heme exporter protein A